MPKRFSRGWLLACVFACLSAQPVKQGEDEHFDLDYDFEDFSPEKYVNKVESVSPKLTPMRNAKGRADYVVFARPLEPDAEMLPAHYTGVKPPGVDHMEIREDSAGLGSSRKANLLAVPADVDSKVIAGTGAASASEAKGAKGRASGATFASGAKGERTAEGHGAEYAKAAGKKATSEDTERRVEGRRDEAAATRSEEYDVEKKGEKGHNSAGYRNVYHRDEYKKDADFYDNDHETARFRKHGRYDEKHRASEGDFREGNSENSAFAAAAAAEKGHREKGRATQEADGRVAESGYDGFFTGLGEVARSVGSVVGEAFAKAADATKGRMRIALPADRDRLMDFMGDSYFRTEPSLVNIGLADCASPPPQLVHLMREQLREGMTIMAETPDGRVVGAAINAGCCPWDAERMIEFAERCCRPGPTRDLVRFYAHVTGQPRLWQRWCTQKIFECCHLAVDARRLGAGVGRRLVKESWLLARDCGYRVFRIDCTSVYTAKIAEGFGWECVFAKPYKRHVDDNRLVFKHIREPHTEVRVYADRPLTCKDYCPSNPDNCEITSAPKDK